MSDENMKNEIDELRGALCASVEEIVIHNDEYKYTTSEDKIEAWRKLYGARPCYESRTMEPDTDPTPDEIHAEPLMQVFKHMHLRAELRVVSQPYCELARQLLKLPRNPERSVALRKLRESKDCAVTALLWVSPNHDTIKSA